MTFEEFLQRFAVACSAMLTIIALAGLVGRFVVRRIVMPWLNEKFVVPLRDTQHQVTTDHHATETPTVPDLLHELSDQVARMDEVFSGHMGESLTVWQRFDRRLEALEDWVHRWNRQRKDT